MPAADTHTIPPRDNTSGKADIPPPMPPPAEPGYPALGEVPDYRHLTACETLCWWGYGRVIPKEVYYAPLATAPRGATTGDLLALLHRSVPDPKPTVCPMREAERRLTERLRSKKLAALVEQNGTLVEAPAETYEYAVAVNARGSIEADSTAPNRDADRAAHYLGSHPELKLVWFRTSDLLEVLEAWPKNLDHATALQQSPRPGRKHNGRDYRAADAPLVAEMRKLIDAKEAISPEHAARAFVARAAGATDASKVKRLAKRYRETPSQS